MTFNSDPTILTLTALFTVLTLRMVGGLLWVLIDKKSFEENREIIKKTTLSALIIVFLVGIMLTLFLGYQTSTPHTPVGVQEAKRSVQHLVIPTQEEIEAESKARELKLIKEREDQIKKEKEESERAYKEALKS